MLYSWANSLWVSMVVVWWHSGCEYWWPFLVLNSVKKGTLVSMLYSLHAWVVIMQPCWTAAWYHVPRNRIMCSQCVCSGAVLLQNVLARVGVSGRFWWWWGEKDTMGGKGSKGKYTVAVNFMQVKSCHLHTSLFTVLFLSLTYDIVYFFFLFPTNFLSFLVPPTSPSDPPLEWHTDGLTATLEEQSGQALLWSWGLYDLLQCHPQLPLLTAQDDLPDMQEEVPLCMPGEVYIHNIPHLRQLVLSKMAVFRHSCIAMPSLDDRVYMLGVRRECEIQLNGTLVHCFLLIIISSSLFFLPIPPLQYKWFSTSNKSSCPLCRNIFWHWWCTTPIIYLLFSHVYITYINTLCSDHCGVYIVIDQSHKTLASCMENFTMRQLRHRVTNVRRLSSTAQPEFWW